jgi:hypothetical protein
MTHVVYAEPSSDIRREDELRVGALSLDVLAVFQPSESGTYLRADCEAQQP